VVGWLVIAKPLSNKTEVAVDQPTNIAEPKEAESPSETNKQPSQKAQEPAESGTAGGYGQTNTDITMPSELTTTGPTDNLALTALLAGVAIYLVLLNRRLAVEHP
jgi:hypothetical protein